MKLYDQFNDSNIAKANIEFNLARECIKWQNNLLKEIELLLLLQKTDIEFTTLAYNIHLNKEDVENYKKSLIIARQVMIDGSASLKFAYQLMQKFDCA